MTELGGAGTLEDNSRLIAQFSIIGAAVGSLFVFKGKYRAVLITTPCVQRKMPCLGPPRHQPNR